MPYNVSSLYYMSYIPSCNWRQTACSTILQQDWPNLDPSDTNNHLKIYWGKKQVLFGTYAFFGLKFK